MRDAALCLRDRHRKVVVVVCLVERVGTLQLYRRGPKKRKCAHSVACLKPDAAVTLCALAMASIRIALDDWLLYGGSLPTRVRTALSSVRIE